jgi:hypothetical protein
MRRSIEVTVPPEHHDEAGDPGNYPGEVHASARPEPLRMVRLMTADDGFGAKVVVARLGVEGIVWELRGGVDGPYPFGPVHIFVTEADLAEARAVLAAVSPLDEAEEDRDEADDAVRRNRHAVLVGAGVIGLLALGAAELVRLLTPR